MKKYIFLFLYITPICLFGQKVKWANDTVYKDAKPYCLLRKSGGLETVFSIQSLSGKEIAVSNLDKEVKNENGYPYFRFSFVATKSVADFPNGINLGKKMAEAIVANGLFIGDSLDPRGEERFLLLYPQQHAASINNNIYVVGGNATAYTMVERDRKGIIFINGASIKQSNVEIGSCTERTGAANGTVYKTISFYLPNGTKCAEATFEGATTTSCIVVTLKDNSKHPLEISNMAERDKEIAKWLVENYYL